MATSDLQDLKRLLEDERHYLKEGGFSALPALVKRKEALLVRLSAQSSDLAGLRAAVVRAEENQRLIVAALKGIQSARQRLRAIRDAGNGMGTYTAKGRALRLGLDVSQVVRLA